MFNGKNIAKLSNKAKKLLTLLDLSEEEFASISKTELLEEIAFANIKIPTGVKYQDIFKLIFYKGILIMSITDTKNEKIIEINEEFTNSTGYTREEAIGKTHIELGLIDSEKKEYLEKEIAKKGFIKDLIIEVTKKDNTKIFCNFNGQYISFNNQKSFLTVAKDITQYKNSEEALRKERILLNMLIDNIPVGVYIKDKKGHKIFVNKSDIQNIGRSKEEILGKTDYEIFGSDLATEYCEDDKLVIEKGETILNKTEKIIDPNGNEKWLLTSKVPLYDVKNNIEGLVGIGVDITGKKKSDDELKKYREHLEAVVEERTIELKKANEQLEKEVQITTRAKKELLNSLEREVELNKIRSRFISTTSHEFKTPLTTILSSTELIEIFIKKNDNQKVNKHIERIKSTVDYLDGLINDVLLLNRTEMGKIKFQPKKTLLYNVIKEIIDTFSNGSMIKNRIIYNSYLNKNNLYILDKKLLEMGLNNLLSNACKYSLEDAEIIVNVSEQKDFINIDVIDTGIGIHGSEINLIFDQFYRGSNSEYVPGTGLGLAIAKKAIELHNGKVTVSSEIDKGSKFTILLPSEVSIG